MRQLSKLSPVMLLAAAVMATAPSADATVITTTINLPPTSPYWVMAPNFDLLDPAIGTLNSVDVSISTTMNADIAAQNISETAGMYSATVAGNLSLYFIDTTQFDSLQMSSTSYTQYLTGDNGPGSYFSVTGISLTATSDDLFTDPTSLGYFTGTGTSAFYVVASDLSYTTGDTPLQGGVEDTIAATLVLTMDYTPVGGDAGDGQNGDTVGSDPTVTEPAALLLFGIAAISLAGTRRRRRGAGVA